MSRPTSEQIVKLPKWAQEHIRDLERQRMAAVEALEDFTAKNDTGPVCCRLMVSDGASRGPSSRQVRFDARWVEIDHAGVHVDLTLAEGEVRVAYTLSARAAGCVYLQPTSFQQFKLKSKLEL